MAKKRRTVREVGSHEAADFVARRLAELGVRQIPRPWLLAVATRLPKSIRDNDDLQEEIARGFGIISALTFGLSESSQRAVSGAIEEGLEEIGQQAHLHAAGEERKRYVRTAMTDLQEKLKKKFSEGEAGKNFWDTLASLNAVLVLRFWHWFGSLLREQRELLREQGSNIVASSERVTMILEMPGPLRLEELKSYFKTAPKLAGPKKGPLDDALAKIGIVTHGVEHMVKKFQEDVDRSSERMQEDVDLYRKVGF